MRPIGAASGDVLLLAALLRSPLLECSYDGKQKHDLPTSKKSPNLSGPKELQPFIQYAASSTSTSCFLAPFRRHATRDTASFDSKSLLVSSHSRFDSAQISVREGLSV
jgi:hypothetical protein